MLADDEDLWECNGSTLAGLGKREDRHAVIETVITWVERETRSELVKYVIAEHCISDADMFVFYCYADTSPSMLLVVVPFAPGV